jgi:hypothetical protein
MIVANLKLVQKLFPLHVFSNVFWIKLGFARPLALGLTHNICG